MDDVRLTATNPEDSSVVPVACNSKGELLLEEPIQGPPGQDGAPGEQGPPGKDGIDGIPLPPDPYEGAILGWLNNQLAWIGTPPVPIPEGVFGPIVSWDSGASYLVIDGPIPENVRNGVYVYQCDERGDYFTEGWNTSEAWSSSITGQYDTRDYVPANAFNGTLDGKGWIPFGTPISVWTLGTPLTGTSFFRIHGQRTDNSGNTIKVTQIDNSVVDISSQVGASRDWYTISGVTSIKSIEFKGVNNSTQFIQFWAFEVGGKILVDSSRSLNMRVNQRYGDGLIGVPTPADKSFTVGKYLFVPGQRVSPWVYYEGDPTSFVDHLRQSED